MGIRLKLSDLLVAAAAAAAAVGVVISCFFFLFFMIWGPARTDSQQTAELKQSPTRPLQPTKEEESVEKILGPLSPTRPPSPIPTSSPLPTLYAQAEETEEVLSLPVVIEPTEISASTVFTNADRQSEPELITHIIRPDENLYRISRRYGVSVQAIVDLNSLTRPSIINPGRTLLIPGSENKAMADDPVLSEALPQTFQEVEALSAVVTVPTPLPKSGSPEPPSAQSAGSDSAALPSLTPEAELVEDPPPEPLVLEGPTPEAISQTALPEPTNTPSEPAPPLYSINGLPLDSIVVMSPEVKQHVREIYDYGQTLGNNSRAFSKVGDSTSAHPYFLAHFDSGTFNLGPYSYLQSTVNHFSGSFARVSVANRVGMHSWTATDPAAASNAVCLPNETPIACEIRLHRPIVILIRLGSNDRGASGLFDSSMRQAVQIALDNGVIPVLGTKPDRFEGSSNINNIMIRQIAADYRIPLWELDQAAAAVPGRGLGSDNVHLTSLYPYDYGLSWAMQRGHAVQNISALMTLQTILESLGLLTG